jgi:hypothetical protein
MRRVSPGVVKRGLKAVWSRVIEWLREWTKPDHHGLAGGAVAEATRSKSELMLENALLRQQLIVLERQAKCPQLSWWERGIMVLLASKLRNWKGALFIVQPDTLLKWHRDLSGWCGGANHSPSSRADDHRCRDGWCNSSDAWPARIHCGEPNAFGVRCSNRI